MATTSAIPASRLHGVEGRPSYVTVGTIVWLSSELMFFATLFASYFTVRSVVPDLWEQETQLLNFPFAFGNTMILVLSSVTCQLGVNAAARGDVQRLRMWYIISFVMGAVFVGGQAFEYAELVQHGLTLQSSVYGSLFYLATGIHGIHVIGGLIAFLVVIGRTYAARRFTHEQAVTSIVVSYYWHFVDVVWIALFAAIYIIQ